MGGWLPISTMVMVVVAVAAASKHLDACYNQRVDALLSPYAVKLTSQRRPSPLAASMVNISRSSLPARESHEVRLIPLSGFSNLSASKNRLWVHQ